MDEDMRPPVGGPRQGTGQGTGEGTGEGGGEGPGGAGAQGMRARPPPYNVRSADLTSR
ncbi:hypothetical protein GCM10010493_39250 [Streptomyces lavendulae subsp. grasserius]